MSGWGREWLGETRTGALSRGQGEDGGHLVPHHALLGDGKEGACALQCEHVDEVDVVWRRF